jgi:hypothetical protein
MLETEDNNLLMFGGLALRDLCQPRVWSGATGLSVPSPANAHNPRASGFPLLSLADASTKFIS